VPSSPHPPRGSLAQVGDFGRMVKISHTIFGLPFTVVALLLASERRVAGGGAPVNAAEVAWIVLAFTAARTAAMGFNRIVDRDIDGENPRTADREIPSGKISLTTAWIMTLLAALTFVAAAAMLGPWPLRLAGPCLLLVFGYSLFKRFSAAAHLVVGLALSLGPGGAWLAITGSFDDAATPLALMLAVGTWVAGFDVLYSLQDEAFDRARGLHSIPAALGTKGAVIVSGLLHLVTIAALVAVHDAAQLGPAHVLGAAVVTGLLVYEHWLVGPGRLEKLDRAFFSVNGWISLGYLACVIVDRWAA